MKTFIVLGMHRSATSLIARSLHGECYMGDEKHMIPPAPDNPKGFYEDRRVVLLNDAILEAAGGSWFNPPPREAIILAGKKRHNGHKFEDYIANTMQQLYNEAGDKSVGIKDPRLCLTVDLWLPYIIDPHYILSYRNPVDIAKSLDNRKDMPGMPQLTMPQWISLVKEYNSRTERFIQRNVKYN